MEAFPVSSTYPSLIDYNNACFGRVLDIEDDIHRFFNFDEANVLADSGSPGSVTKVIKKNDRTHRRSYTNTSNEMRRELIEAVNKGGEKVKNAAKRLGIKYSCAKTICQIYKREGRLDKKISRSGAFQENLSPVLNINSQQTGNDENKSSEVLETASTSPILTPPSNSQTQLIPHKYVVISQPVLPMTSSPQTEKPAMLLNFGNANNQYALYYPQPQIYFANQWGQQVFQPSCYVLPMNYNSCLAAPQFPYDIYAGNSLNG